MTDTNCRKICEELEVMRMAQGAKLAPSVFRLIEMGPAREITADQELSVSQFILSVMMYVRYPRTGMYFEFFNGSTVTIRQPTEAVRKHHFAFVKFVADCLRACKEQVAATAGLVDAACPWTAFTNELNTHDTTRSSIYQILYLTLIIWRAKEWDGSGLTSLGAAVREAFCGMRNITQTTIYDMQEFAVAFAPTFTHEDGKLDAIMKSMREKKNIGWGEMITFIVIVTKRFTSLIFDPTETTTLPELLDNRVTGTCTPQQLCLMNAPVQATITGGGVNDMHASFQGAQLAQAQAQAQAQPDLQAQLAQAQPDLQAQLAQAQPDLQAQLAQAQLALVQAQAELVQAQTQEREDAMEIVEAPSNDIIDEFQAAINDLEEKVRISDQERSQLLELCSEKDRVNARLSEEIKNITETTTELYKQIACLTEANIELSETQKQSVVDERALKALLKTSKKSRESAEAAREVSAKQVHALQTRLDESEETLKAMQEENKTLTRQLKGKRKDKSPDSDASGSDALGEQLDSSAKKPRPSSSK